MKKYFIINNNGTESADGNNNNLNFITKPRPALQPSTVPFEFVVDSGNDAQYKIKTFYNDYNYRIQTSDNQDIQGLTDDYTITFPQSNTLYKVSISGVFPKFQANGGNSQSNADKFIRVLKFGNQKWLSLSNMFKNARNMRNNDDTGNGWNRCEGLDAEIDMTYVTDMSYMFYGTEIYTYTAGSNRSTIDDIVSQMNTSGVKSVAYMFSGYKLQNNNIKKSFFGYIGNHINAWDFSNMVTTEGLFRYCQISFSGAGYAVQVPKLENCSYMYHKISLFGSDRDDLMEFDSIPSMVNMSYYKGKVNHNWDFSGVRDISYMYYWDIFANNTFNYNYTIDTSSVINMEGLFQGSRLATIDINDWDFSKVENMSNMFRGCNDMYPSGFDFKLWDTSNLIDSSFMFYDSNFSGSQYNDVDKFDTSNIVNMSNMFARCNFDWDISNWDVSSVDDMSEMFYDTPFNQNLSNWNVSSVTNMNGLFRNCSNLTSTNIPNWNTSSVNSMHNLFRNCSSLINTNILSNWNVSSVTNMNYMFSDCQNLATLDLSNWNTSSVTYMNRMFRNCSNLTDLTSIENWDVSSVTNMDYMFKNVSGLTTQLNLSDWCVTNFNSKPTGFDDNTNNMIFTPYWGTCP